jgi:hypothetical protein
MEISNPIHKEPDEDRMALLHLAKRVLEMRNMQKKWFKDREPADLRYAKDMERRVDRLLDEIFATKNGQPSLF